MAASSHGPDAISLGTLAATATRTRPHEGWLYGRNTDLLVGAGVGYLISVPLLVLFTEWSGVGAWSVTLVALFTLLISTPHYGATILRVYEQREDRRRYAIFAVWATIALCGFFVLGIHHAIVGSVLVTLFATWSPWHFSGQNYGLALMFLRRRGVVVEARAKRLLYTSFFLSFALSFLVMHGQGYSVTVASAPVVGGSMFEFLQLGVPASALQVAVPLAVLAYGVSLAEALRLLLRDARLRDIAPAICLVVVQATWFAIPAAMRAFGSTPLNGLAFTFIWVSAAHSAQYLWVTSYYAKRGDPYHRLGTYLERTLLAGLTVTVFPGLIFAPGLMGKIPWDTGLAVLLISVVNIHHFILDGAIWKLRDGRVARLLLKDSDDGTAGVGTAPSLAPQRSWFRPVVAVLGLASLTIFAIDVWQREFIVNRAGKDVDRLISASQWLGWIGRDSPQLHSRIGHLLSQDRPEAAISAFQRSLDLHPSSYALTGLGEAHADLEQWQEASEAFTEALALSPYYLPALVGAGEASLELGQPDRARQSLKRALSLAPGQPEIQRLLRQSIAAEQPDP